MPRRRRLPKTRIAGASQLTPAQRAWFANEFAFLDVMGGPGYCSYAHEIVFATVDEARAAWDQHRDSLIAEYEAAHPGKRPWPCEEWNDNA